MDTEKLTEQLKKHGPTAGIALVTAIVAVNLAVPDSPDLPAIPPLLAEIQQVEQHARAAPGSSQTRLVSCGDSNLAAVTGDDVVGVVTLGGGSTCTVLFASRWAAVPTCLVEGGTVQALDETDLIVSSVTDGAFSYRCAPSDGVAPTARAALAKPRPTRHGHVCQDPKAVPDTKCDEGTSLQYVDCAWSCAPVADETEVAPLAVPVAPHLGSGG